MLEHAKEKKGPSLSPRARHGRTAAMGFWAVAAIIPSFLGPVPVFRHNLHTVTPGVLYRSGQMGRGDFRRVVAAYGIRTVVNLRGPQPEPWYAKEKETARALALHYVDIPDFDAHRLPPPRALIDLLRTLHHGPYPMLIHCKAGADRTGLACVLYRAIIERQPLQAARREQLNWWYGHFPIGKTRAMDEFFSLYRRTGREKNLERWIAEDYPSLYQSRQSAE